MVLNDCKKFRSNCINKFQKNRKNPKIGRFGLILAMVLKSQSLEHFWVQNDCAEFNFVKLVWTVFENFEIFIEVGRKRHDIA